MAPDFGHRRVLNFHAGDAFFFSGPGAIAFRGRAEQLPEWLERLIGEREIQAVYLFGDGRPYHRVAIEIATRRALPVYVFEEGYLRPDWITLERGGVNGYSSMPRDPRFFREFARDRKPPEGHQHVGRTFGIGALYATLLALAATLAFFRYPHYRHHRSINCWLQMCLWVRGAFRKYWYRLRERGQLGELANGLRETYFLVALQVYCDYQIVHSRFETIEQFIEEVMRSFAAHAPRDCALVFKHHPMDRAYRDYTALLKQLTKRHGLHGRVIYLHDQHLPTLLRHARGAVMINSTVGLQAISYGRPVKVLGDAVYDMPGLTYQGPLEQFWQEVGTVDEELYKAFRTYLLCTNQANGSFAKRLPGVRSCTGIRWFPGPPPQTEGGP
jgi:capsule polysaccharide modification protein KpsS